jgi:hypothetical protein
MFDLKLGGAINEGNKSNIIVCVIDNYLMRMFNRNV